MQTKDCWREVSALIKSNQVDEAIRLCAQEPYVQDARCQVYLGIKYCENEKFDAAEKCFSVAAQMGDRNAECNLGAVNFKRRNYAAAFEWLSLAKAHGAVNANFWLGQLYEHGRGTDKNIEQAKNCYAAAALNGNVMAERARLDLAIKTERFWGRLSSRLRKFRLFLTAMGMALCNYNDPRLTDAKAIFTQNCKGS